MTVEIREIPVLMDASNLAATYKRHDHGVTQLITRLGRVIEYVPGDDPDRLRPNQFTGSPRRMRDPLVGYFPRDLVIRYTEFYVALKLYFASADHTSVDRAVSLAIEATVPSAFAAYVQILPERSLRRLEITSPTCLRVIRTLTEPAKSTASILADEESIFDGRLVEAIDHRLPIVRAAK